MPGEVVLQASLKALLSACLLFSVWAQAADPQVEFHTSMGNYVVELYPERAPQTTANFLQYVNSGFYDGTIFHRVIKGFVAQEIGRAHV